MKKNITGKQRAFIEYFCGNFTEAARMAGYKNPGMAGSRLMKKDYIVKAIRKREEKMLKEGILSRMERQKFWSDIISGNIKEKTFVQGPDGFMTEVEVDPNLKDKLRASELLGKSEADFIDRSHISSDNAPLSSIEVNFVGVSTKNKKDRS